MFGARAGMESVFMYVNQCPKFTHLGIKPNNTIFVHITTLLCMSREAEIFAITARVRGGSNIKSFACQV